ncbi:MAG: SH3 domain-containing protein [Pyrinomonadaceae bacterium]
MFKNLRQSILVLVVVTSFLAFGFAVSAESNAQTSKKSAKSSPTPKKNAKATPTPGKKTQAKSAPTPKKSATSAKSKSADKKTLTTKADSKSTRAKKKTRTETARNSKDAKSTAKNSSSSKSKGKVEAETGSKIKNSKSASKTRNSKSAATAKNSSAKKAGTSRRTETKLTAKSETKSAVKSKPKTEETATIPDAPQFIVTDVSAQIRTQAKANAPELSKVKLGTVLNVSQKSASWYKVQFSNGAKTSVGWIPASSVGSLDAANKPQIYSQVANRYYKPDMDFATSSALYEFLTRSKPEFETSDSAADLELKRLLALRAALKTIPASAKTDAPYKDFLKAHDKEIVYSEPSGEYLVASNLFWGWQKKEKAAPLADQIAWEGEQNPLPGECEGYVNCHLFYARMTSGEYLNLHPTGKHNLEALTNLTNLLQPIVADLDAKQIYNGPTDVTDRAEFNNLIAELRTIVSRLPLTKKEKTLQQLKKVAEGFR